MYTSNLSDLGPLYHSYEFFGVHNKQLPGMYAKNQKSKEKIIRAYTQLAIAKCATSIDKNISFLEMFCADGYYAMVARKLGATVSYGIDNDKDGYFGKAQQIADRLGLDNIFFISKDINELTTFKPVDIVANIGGLYHMSNPEAVLDLSYALAREYLIVQTVVSLANNDPEYFEAPAPGWTWGSRYNKKSFDSMIRSKNWTIVDSHFALLEGNERLEDRGSVSYLVKKSR